MEKSRTRPFTVSLFCESFGDVPFIYDEKERLEKAFEEEILKGNKFFIIDLEVGASLIAGTILLELKKKYPQIRLVAVDSHKDHINDVVKTDEDTFICNTTTFEPIGHFGFPLMYSNIKINCDLYHCLNETEDCKFKRDMWMINKSSTVLVLSRIGKLKDRAKSLDYALKRKCKLLQI